MSCSCSQLDTAHSQTQQVPGMLLGSGALGSSTAKMCLGCYWLLAIRFPTSTSHPISTAGCPKVFLITSKSHLYLTKKQTRLLQLNILVNITLYLNSSPLSYTSLEHCFYLSLWNREVILISRSWLTECLASTDNSSKGFICIHQKLVVLFKTTLSNIHLNLVDAFLRFLLLEWSGNPNRGVHFYKGSSGIGLPGIHCGSKWQISLFRSCCILHLLFSELCSC